MGSWHWVPGATTHNKSLLHFLWKYFYSTHLDTDRTFCPYSSYWIAPLFLEVSRCRLDAAIPSWIMEAVLSCEANCSSYNNRTQWRRKPEKDNRKFGERICKLVRNSKQKCNVTLQTPSYTLCLWCNPTASHFRIVCNSGNVDQTANSAAIYFVKKLSHFVKLLSTYHLQMKCIVCTTPPSIYFQFWKVEVKLLAKLLQKPPFTKKVWSDVLCSNFQLLVVCINSLKSLWGISKSSSGSLISWYVPKPQSPTHDEINRTKTVFCPDAILDRIDLRPERVSVTIDWQSLTVKRELCVFSLQKGFLWFIL